MLTRVLAFAFLLSGTPAIYSQEAVVDALPQKSQAPVSGHVESAWLDLRQFSPANSKAQVAPPWVEAVTTVTPQAQAGLPAKTIFRIRLTAPRPELQVLMFRLFFDDKPDRQPDLVAWDESGTQVLQSGPLGLGVDLPSSDTVMVPMTGVSTIDVEVPGDGATIRGAYLDWMASSEVLHPLSAQHRDLIPEPFAAAAPLHAPNTDTEVFGTVTATLASETIRIGASVQTGAAFQFGIESQPLVALVSFEVASPNIDAPPELYLNGESLGPVSLTLPELADPAYRGQMTPLVRQMRFQYTGWLRAQKIVPPASLRPGTNDLLIIGGAGTAASAIRATQIQLKYLWDKSDYQLQSDAK
ncbi:MAG: hypothetical protein ABI944_02595 [Chthoniobacterales bacterium]